MDHEEVGRYWDENAKAWIRLARAGYDVYRDHLNTPAFFEMLPAVDGLRGLDIGCGEGHNTRLLARRGARVTAIDISGTFIGAAREEESREPLGIDYRVASAVDLPFPGESFDFAVAFMSLMDIPETRRVLEEAYRVLEPGGFLQFSIEHPCFTTPHRRKLKDANGISYAVEVGRYFDRRNGEIDEWIFGAAPPEATEGLGKFRIPRFTRPVSEWLNLILETGFRPEKFAEPFPPDDLVERIPRLQDSQVVAYFLQVRARKPRGTLPDDPERLIEALIPDPSEPR